MRPPLSLLLFLLISANAAADLPLSFQSLADYHGSVILLIDSASGSIKYANESAVEFYEFGAEELLNMNISDINTMTEKEVTSEIAQATGEKRNYFLFYHKKKSGAVVPVEVYSYPIELDSGVFLFSIVYDISQRVESARSLQRSRFVFSVLTSSIIAILIVISIFLLKISRSRSRTILDLKNSEARYKKLQDKLIYENNHDSLTGLYNRRYFEVELKRLDKERNYPIAVIVSDLNGLKLANDAFGHEVGDKLICTAADTLKNTCRSDEIISRWGGDEFIILIKNGKEENIKKIISRISRQSQNVDVNNIPLSLSVGWSTKICESQKIEDVLEQADKNMYSEKSEKSEKYKHKLIKNIQKNMTSHYILKKLREMSKIIIDFSRFLDLNSEAVERVKLFTEFHDIGVISLDHNFAIDHFKLIPEAQDEVAAVKRHCEVGYRITSMHPQYAVIADEVLCHHENFDGSGYPKGLEGTSIPLISRMYRICEGYYKYKKPNEEESLEKMKLYSGKIFDPDLTELFIRYRQRNLPRI